MEFAQGPKTAGRDSTREEKREEKRSHGALRGSAGNDHECKANSFNVMEGGGGGCTRGSGAPNGRQLLGRWHVGAGQPGKRGWPALEKEGWRQRGAFVARRACQKGQPGGGGQPQRAAGGAP